MIAAKKRSLVRAVTCADTNYALPRVSNVACALLLQVMLSALRAADCQTLMNWLRMYGEVARRRVPRVMVITSSAACHIKLVVSTRLVERT